MVAGTPRNSFSPDLVAGTPPEKPPSAGSCTWATRDKREGGSWEQRCRWWPRLGEPPPPGPTHAARCGRRLDGAGGGAASVRAALDVDAMDLAAVAPFHISPWGADDGSCGGEGERRGAATRQEGTVWSDRTATGPCGWLGQISPGGNAWGRCRVGPNVA